MNREYRKQHMADCQVKDIARQYVETLNNQPNGIGQHIHPLYGSSENMLGIMWQVFGRDIANNAVDSAFAEKRAALVAGNRNRFIWN